MQSGFETFGQVSPLDVENRGDADSQHGGDIRWSALSVKQVENPGARLASR